MVVVGVVAAVVVMMVEVTSALHEMHIDATASCSDEDVDSECEFAETESPASYDDACFQASESDKESTSMPVEPWWLLLPSCLRGRTRGT